MKPSVKTNCISTLTLLLFILSAISSFAQSTHLKPLLYEVNSNFNYGGLNSAMQSYKKDSKGIQAGASFQAGITPGFSVVTEAYFTMKGATLKTGNPLTGSKSKLRLYNTELPVLARFHINRFYINAGPYLSYAISGRVKTEGSHTSPATSTSISFHKVTGGFRRWEMGLQAGAGYNFNIKQTSLVLDIRYGYGLTNISQDAERYNRAFNISIIAFKPWKTNPFARKG